MIAAVRAAILKPQGYSSNVKNVLFHSTPILQRKHKSNSETRNKKLSRSRAKEDLRRLSVFQQIWSDGFDYSDKHSSWFEKQYYRVCKRNRTGGRYIHQPLDKSCFDFSGVDDECEIEYFLRSALGASYKERKSRWRERHFYGSNTEGEARTWRYSKNSNTGRSWGSRQRLDQEEEKEEEHSSTEVNDLDSIQQSHRQTLGLSSSGPLTLGDVKNAYRVCALKWHPDHHHDSTTKAAAEEKFKLCNVAYESLCEKFAMN
ncbi:J domain-containing protein [Hirschfeldia incana]|nr:J domain-containing protein [Hirschfeldia incana]